MRVSSQPWQGASCTPLLEQASNRTMSIAAVAVIVPAFCEAALIERTIASIPDRVRSIYVVDDASTDNTSEKAKNSGDPRVRVLRHEENRGVGAAIFTGYRQALAEGAEILVVMAGDNQMDPRDLPRLIQPIEDERADYVKGNRLVHEDVLDMPRLRRWGSRSLAIVTSWVGGISIGDSQCGYTALSARAATDVLSRSLWSGYGYPNDLLLTLAAQAWTIEECPVRPVYGNETSGLRPWHMLLILAVIARRAWLNFLSGKAQQRPQSAPS
jgi:glycosyltransferase involved in cell wall biosynthesis